MSKNYRKIYENYFGKIPNGCIIHHIDHNKNNNNLKNLLALPKKLHRKYHTSFIEFENIPTINVKSPYKTIFLYTKIANTIAELKEEIHYLILKKEGKIYVRNN